MMAQYDSDKNNELSREEVLDRFKKTGVAAPVESRREPFQEPQLSDNEDKKEEVKYDWKECFPTLDESSFISPEEIILLQDDINSYVKAFPLPEWFDSKVPSFSYPKGAVPSENCKNIDKVLQVINLYCFTINSTKMSLIR
ncbi:hypothetical protein DICPUDRAFT_73960 [Dictyostelium purpureum]|uniref:EF-hand domain-containing protein n=1 Tax=Dictyostelium purpureum TaxID=5786 RepID=F0Z6C8_DICPU|nr:uncharacterized protein DICPUDRAFT_73960 [Dictyostelium purpureum]EGC40419.1 hypothetical protein DICPUDRAFT_73960 [Dictyostelium purpureum]|eukprot:XP_003282966.1 hypothetical protein DICPUDRAFT_73960 [Dictyostelium purpureum]